MHGSVCLPPAHPFLRAPRCIPMLHAHVAGVPTLIGEEQRCIHACARFLLLAAGCDRVIAWVVVFEATRAASMMEYVRTPPVCTLHAEARYHSAGFTAGPDHAAAAISLETA